MYVLLRSLSIFTLMMEAIRFSENRFLQELHGATSQKTALFMSFIVCIAFVLFSFVSFFVV
jgi:hypothetical protein